MGSVTTALPCLSAQKQLLGDFCRPNSQRAQSLPRNTNARAAYELPQLLPATATYAHIRHAVLARRPAPVATIASIRGPPPTNALRSHQVGRGRHAYILAARRKQPISTTAGASLSNPSLFSQLLCIGKERAWFFLDIANMFHNQKLSLSLSPNFSHYRPFIFWSFPPTYKLPFDLNCKSAHKITPSSGLPNPPSQSTIPMGFTWSVDIGHYSVRTIVARSLRILTLRRNSIPLSPHPNFLSKRSAPLTLAVDLPMVFHIIDDIMVLTVDWPQELVCAWHKILR